MKKAVILSVVVVTFIVANITASFLTGLGIALTLLISGIGIFFLLTAASGFYLFFSELKTEVNLEYLIWGIVAFVVGIVVLKWLIGVLL